MKKVVDKRFTVFLIEKLNARLTVIDDWCLSAVAWYVFSQIVVGY